MTSDTSTTLHLHRHNSGGHYLGPADMTEQLVSVQNSVMVPYSMLIWLKKSTAKRKSNALLFHQEQSWQ